MISLKPWQPESAPIRGQGLIKRMEDLIIPLTQEKNHREIAQRVVRASIQTVMDTRKAQLKRCIKPELLFNAWHNT